MMPPLKKTAEEIKNRYKYEIDISDDWKTGHRIYDLFFGKFGVSIDKYNFKEKIINLIEIIRNNNTKKDKALLKSYEEKLVEIADSINKIMEKIKEEYRSMGTILYNLTNSCKDNIDKLNVLNTYKRICTEILDKEAEKYIKYEKIFLTFNDDIMDINNKLNLDS